MICHILVKTILLKKNDKKITDHDEYYKEETSKMIESNESVDNYETSDNLRDDSIIKTTTKNRSIDSTVDDYEFKISCNTLCDKYCSFVW